MLVTGATGTLGRDVLTAAVAAGHDARAVSRHDHRDDVDVILHCATQPTGDKDVTSTQNLLDAARRAGVGHVVYI